MPGPLINEGLNDLKTRTIDELLVLQDRVRIELRRRGEISGVWNRCSRCSGTGKHSGGYCICPLGRDLRAIEVGRDGHSYDVQPEADD